MRNNLLLFATLAVFSILVNDGATGGDEGRLIHQAEILRACQYDLSSFREAPYADFFWVAHHLLWFVCIVAVQSLINGIANLTGWLWMMDYVDYALTYIPVTAGICAVFFSYLFVQSHRQSAPIAILVTSCVWLGSSFISLLTGGFIESLMCLIVVFRLFAAHQRMFTGKHLRRLLALDIALVAIKPYAIAFCLPSFLIMVRMRAWPRTYTGIYLLGVTFFLLLTALAKELVADGLYIRHIGDIMIDSIRAPHALLARIIEQLAGFSHGIIWCFPFLFLCFLDRDTLLASLTTLIPCALLILFFALFPFWQGGNGTAGPRYLMPFFLFLLPALADAAAKLASKQPRTRGLVLLLVVLFFPVLDYRHSLVLDNVTRKDLSFSDASRPVYDQPMQHALKKGLPPFSPSFHPAIFAWRVTVAKVFGTPEIEFTMSNGARIPVPTRQIIPQTGVSRFYFIRRSGIKIPDRYAAWLAKWPSFLYYTPAILAVWLGLVFFTFILRAALMAYAQKKPRDDRHDKPIPVASKQ